MLRLKLLGALLALLDLQARPIGRLLQPLPLHCTWRQAGQIFGDMDAQLVQFQQFDLLAFLTSAKNDAQRRGFLRLSFVLVKPAQVMPWVPTWVTPARLRMRVQLL